jgi:thiamine-phosphate pyrophosphorylase
MSPALRILDASLNRAAEGLRVVEDYARFALDDSHLTELLKNLRHDLATAAAAIPWPERHAARDTSHDVGTTITTPTESARPDAWAVCQASLERTKQSLRSLEEYGKVALPAQAPVFESLRYRLYTLEAALGRTVDAVARLADVRLCVLIDGRDSDTEFAALVGDLIDAGVGMIQLRDKQLPVRQLVWRARLLMELVRGANKVKDCSGPLPLVGRAGEGGGSGYPAPTPLPGASHGLPPALGPLGPCSLVPPHQGEGTGTIKTTRPLVIINDRPAIAAAVDADGVHLGQEDFTVKDARHVLGPRALIGVSTHTLAEAQQALLDGANYIGVGPTFPSATKQFAEFPGLELLKQVAAAIRLPAFAIGGIDASNVGDVLDTGVSRVAVSSAVVAAVSPRVAASELLSAFVARP